MMNRSKEPCRNFQRGSCRYGDRCKFLHVTQQQQKPNSFGFGAQSGSQFNQQQQKQNPFGFGVQNSSQSKGASDFGIKNQNQVKPFENKWTRFSPIAPGNATPSRQTDNQPQGANHKCTDPESCKREIAEDFNHERPLWKLTCYGHSKTHPCDIFGDISYEELRAAAYEDAKLGMTLQAIVERERKLLSSKLVEFENLLRNPYVIPPNPSSSYSPAAATQFPATTINAPSMGVQNNVPIAVSSFSQLGSSINSGDNARSLAPSNSVFGPPNPFQVSSQTPVGFGINSTIFGNSGTFGSQPPMQSFGSAPTSNNLNFNNGFMNVGSNLSSFPQVPLPHFPSSANTLLTIPVNGTKDAANAAGDDKKVKVPEDMTIWLKEEWKRGEIPEEPPPDALT